MKSKLTIPQKHALAVIEKHRRVRVSNRTSWGTNGVDGTFPSIYWQAAQSLQRKGLTDIHHDAGGEWVALTDAGRAVIETGGHR